MALDKEFTQIPGTTVFDADQSRKGYWLNQFCMSLMKADNRARFKADERLYLDEWKMTEEQKQAVPRARPQPLHRARRQHLFPRQDRRDRRQELPADGRRHDWHDRAGIPRHDDQGRPEDRGQPQDRRARGRAAPAEGRFEHGSASPPPSTPRTSPPSAPPSTSARPRKIIGSRSSADMISTSNG